MTYTIGSACLDLGAFAPHVERNDAAEANEGEERPSVELRLLPGGRSDAFEQELVLLRPSLRARALRLTRNPVDAEDLVSDALLRALRFQASYERGTNLKAWAHQVLYSVFATNCRRRARDKKAREWLINDPSAWSRNDARPEMSSLTPAMARILDALPENYGTILRLVDLNELPYRDAAAVLGIPVGTVMSRLFRARKLLAERLEQGVRRSA
jgi:RNA polymerase sigma-70 factor, ECF subfamily